MKTMDKRDKLIEKYKEVVEYYSLFHDSATGKIKLPDPRMIGYDVFKANIERLESAIAQLTAEIEKEVLPVEEPQNVKSDDEIKQLAHKKVDWFNDQESDVFWGTDFEVGYFHGYKDAFKFPQQRQVSDKKIPAHLRNRCLMAFEELLFNHNADAVTLPDDQLKMIKKLIKDLQP